MSSTKRQRNTGVISSSVKAGVNKKVDLGEQVGTDLPVYTDFRAIADQDLKEIGLNVDQLAGLAHSHCQFAFPVQSDSSASSTGE